MQKVLLLTGVLGIALLAGATDCRAEKWEKKAFTSNAIEANYEDADSVKVKEKSLTWTEKYVLTPSGKKHYNDLLAKYKGCKENLAKKGEVTQHQIDYEIKEGMYRHLAKRNYNKDNELVCTDKEMDNSFDLSWHRIGRKSPMEDVYYNLVTKYKLGNI